MRHGVIRGVHPSSLGRGNDGNQAMTMFGGSLQVAEFKLQTECACRSIHSYSIIPTNP